MSGRAFFDTNILFYSFQTGEPEKSSIARELVISRMDRGEAVISFQVIQEFLNVAFKKPVPPMTNGEAQLYLQNVLSRMTVIHSSSGIYHRALRLRERYIWSWWDSLVVAAALEAQCDLLYTEDLQHGQRIEGLTLVNPFGKA